MSRSAALWTSTFTVKGAPGAVKQVLLIQRGQQVLLIQRGHQVLLLLEMQGTRLDSVLKGPGLSVVESIKHSEYSTNYQWVPSVHLHFVGLSSDTSSVSGATGAGAAAADAVGPVTIAVGVALLPYFFIVAVAIREAT